MLAFCGLSTFLTRRGQAGWRQVAEQRMADPMHVVTVGGDGSECGGGCGCGCGTICRND